MTVYIALLRGINVGGNCLVKMETLRTLCGTLKLRDAKTYVQSGNVVFRAADADPVKLGRRLEDGIEKTFGHRPPVIIRTAEELRNVAARNPFAGRGEIEPSRMFVTFMASEPAADARHKVLAMRTPPEELFLDGREMFLYCPNGFSKSKLPLAKVDRVLRGTARNWNTVSKLLEMTAEMEG
ncbi:MAG: hypothetical protein JWP63_2733 [Candidatus Solibacter sp.]|nr:hypothetical protein [Candidatus Solibacter sp.]